MLVAVELQVVEATAFCLIGKGLNPGGTRVQILAFRLISDVVNLDGLFLSNSVKPSAFLSRKQQHMYRPNRSKPENRPFQKSLYDEQDLNKLKLGFLDWLYFIEVPLKFAIAFTLNHGPFGKPNPA